MDHAQYALAQGVDLVDVDFGAVLLNRVSGKYWELNEVGGRILHLSVSNVPSEAIINNIAENYEAERATISHDVNQLLESLVDAGLVVRSAS